MRSNIKICLCCGRRFIPRSNVKNQEYCSDVKCQKARRARWQREKMHKDQDYRDNQKRCWEEWIKKHHGYWKEFRSKHPDYVERNRIAQRVRNMKRCKNGLVKLIAKMDSLGKLFSSRKGWLFKLIPKGDRLIAKMDVLTVELVPVEYVRKL